MITAPAPIPEFHRVLLDALAVDYFQPGLADINAWRDFLYFLETLNDSAGGPLTARDIAAAVRLMRQENRDRRASWSLRFARILREPESFRDLVLQARKQKRERPQVRTESRQAGNISIAVERDPAAESDARPASEILREFKEKMKGPQHAPKNEEPSDG
jgi:hypothetical protein